MSRFIVKRRDLQPGELSRQVEISCGSLHALWKQIEPHLPLTDEDWLVDVELIISVCQAIPEAPKAAGDNDA